MRDKRAHRERIMGLREAAADPDRWGIKPKVDGVRGLVVLENGCPQTRTRRGISGDWLRGDAFENRTSSARIPAADPEARHDPR
jgi:hypothetical protein